MGREAGGKAGNRGKQGKQIKQVYKSGGTLMSEMRALSASVRGRHEACKQKKGGVTPFASSLIHVFSSPRHTDNRATHTTPIFQPGRQAQDQKQPDACYIVVFFSLFCFLSSRPFSIPNFICFFPTELFSSLPCLSRYILFVLSFSPPVTKDEAYIFM